MKRQAETKIKEKIISPFFHKNHYTLALGTFITSASKKIIIQYLAQEKKQEMRNREFLLNNIKLK